MRIDVPIADLPSRMRFGLARGTVYELEQLASKQKEYIGFPLNLASRLQRYCPDLAFIASARIKFPPHKLEVNGYKKVIATCIRGFPRELVLVGRKEYDLIPRERRQELFEDPAS